MSFILQIGQVPGLDSTTSGCIGQVIETGGRLAGAGVFADWASVRIGSVAASAAIAARTTDRQKAERDAVKRAGTARVLKMAPE